MNRTVLKYVRHTVAGFIVWPKNVDEVHHAHVGKMLDRNRNTVEGKVVSAGFIEFTPDQLPYCYGRSESLGIVAGAGDTQALRAEWGISSTPTAMRASQAGNVTAGFLVKLAIVSVVAWVLLLLGSVMGSDDETADWVDSPELLALQQTEAGTARRQAAAEALCAQERGPNSQARWTPDGDLVCTAPRIRSAAL